jgi:2-polyprenyl-6-methoxyphenol hydroxylase-like FAD-dependent oxidoreductase
LRSIDIADDLVQEGIKGAGYQMYEGPHRFLDMSWSCLNGKTNYPFTLLLAQHHTERILISKLTSLGVSVKWKHKATSIAANDGSHSRIREWLHDYCAIRSRCGWISLFGKESTLPF